MFTITISSAGADATTAISDAISAIGATQPGLIIVDGPAGLSAGTFTFTSNIQVEFTNGGQLVTTSTPTLNFEGPVIADPSVQIFSGFTGSGGAVSFTFITEVYAEWWGALGNGTTDDSKAIQAALNSMSSGGRLQLRAKSYGFGTMLAITTSGVSIEGLGINKSILLSLSDISGVKVSGTYAGTPSFCSNVNIRNLSILAGAGSAAGTIGLSLLYTALANVERVEIYGFETCVKLQRATNTVCNFIVAQMYGTQPNPKGFWLDGSPQSSDTSGSNAGNVSSIFRDCGSGAGPDYAGTGTTYGYYIANSGSTGDCGDLLFENCATSQTAYGYLFNFTNSAVAGDSDSDIQLINPICDNYTQGGVVVENAPDNFSAFTILGGWFDPINTGSSNIAGISIGAMRGVTIIGAQFWPIANSFAHTVWGVLVQSASSGVIVSGCLFNGVTRGVEINNSSSCTIVGNRFFSQEQSSFGQAMNPAVNTVSATNVSITGNIFECLTSGGLAYGLQIDNASKSVTAVANTFSSNITTKIAVVSGATNCMVENNPGYNPVGLVTGPSFTSGTAVQNNTGTAAMVAVAPSATSATTVTIGSGIVQILAAGAVSQNYRVPAGQYITLTWGTGSPSWAWFLD